MSRSLLLLLLVAVLGEGPGQGPTSRRHGPLSLEEAEILIYLTPQVQEARSRGTQVTWDAQVSPYWNSVDFFNFWVVAVPRGKGPTVTPTLCWCSVDKHTGDVVVWDPATGREDQVDTLLLEGAQAVIRKAHGIGPAVLKERRGRSARLASP